MARIWKIRKFDGDNHKQVWSVSGALSEPEICTMLQRLVSQNLSDDEIISASLRKNDRHHNTLLERIGRGTPICYGEGIYYTAQSEEK